MTSQTTYILNALQSGRKLTALDALNDFGCLRLAARISDLRKAGYSITMRIIATRNGKRISEYTM